MRLPEIVIDDFELTARPALSTDGSGDRQAPGAGQARDEDLDAQARGPDRTPEGHEPIASEQQAVEDVMESIREATMAHCIAPALPPTPIDPVLALKRL